jgi:hypothetical protein
MVEKSGLAKARSQGGRKGRPRSIGRMHGTYEPWVHQDNNDECTMASRAEPRRIGFGRCPYRAVHMIRRRTQ